METHHKKIKPLLNRSLCLQNVNKYHDLCIKRPKTILNFKFLKKIDPFISSNESYRNIQTKLHKALKLLKSVRKLDLLEYGIRGPSINQAKLLSIFKKISKAESISMKRVIDPYKLKESYIEKWLRHLPQILHLNWGLVVFGTKRDAENSVNHQSHIRNPLKYLHYCPKIRSLKIDSSASSNVFLQKAIKIKRYPPSLKHLYAKAQLNGEQLSLSQRNFQRLKSLGFTFDPVAQSFDSTIDILNSLSKMTDLTEIDLQFVDFMMPGIETVFAKISQERKLNKIKLDFDFEMPDFSKIFQSLKVCPIAHFSLKTFYVNDKAVLEAISDFISEMILLESLDISLINPASFKETDPLKSICKQISKLQKLRHLELSFKSYNDHIKDYVLEPHDISLKHLKLETFTLQCTQFDSPRPLSHFITQLENSSDSLQKLNLGLENHFPNKQSNVKTLNFIKRLGNIRELRLPRLEISSIKFLNEIAQTVQTLKYLRSFQLGRISNQIPSAEFAKVFEMILSKKGLKDLYCLIDQSYLRQMQGESPIDMHKIMRINPSLEQISSSPFGLSVKEFKELRSW